MLQSAVHNMCKLCLYVTIAHHAWHKPMDPRLWPRGCVHTHTHWPPMHARPSAPMRVPTHQALLQLQQRALPHFECCSMSIPPTKYSLMPDRAGRAATLFSVSSRSSTKCTVAPDSATTGRCRICLHTLMQVGGGSWERHAARENIGIRLQQSLMPPSGKAQTKRDRF